MKANKIIPLSKQLLDEETYEDVRKVLESGWWTMGPITEQLEYEFAKYKGSRYAIAVNSCSMALFLCMKLVCEKDDRVLTTPLTFCSTVNAIILAGAKPCFVDVDLRTQNMTLKDFNSENVDYFDGIIFVHFAGYPYDVHNKRILAKYYVIEDCAHAIETKLFNNKYSGTFGDFGCFSFNPIKNVAAPEMGMIITDSGDYDELLRKMRIHGIDSSSYDRVNNPGQYSIEMLGYKANCTDLEAVIALHQLRNIENNYWRRRYIASQYISFLSNSRVFNGFIPEINDNHACHLFTIRLNNRDRFIRKMNEVGIHCGIHYKPIHLHPYYQKSFNFRKGMFPNAEFIGDTTCSLPLGPGMTDEDLEYVIYHMNKILSTGEYLF